MSAIVDPAAAWVRVGYAVVAWGDVVCFIRVGDAADDVLRGRVNAPAHAVVSRKPGTDPAFS